MHLPTVCRHLLHPAWRTRRAFPRRTLSAIEAAIRASEARHGGELRLVIEGALAGAPLYGGQPVRERAIDLFSHLRMWDTEERNGVLIYVLLAERAVEIIADRGVHARVGEAEWARICAAMQAAFRARHFEAGALEGIAAITQLLAAHYPAPAGTRRNELPNSVVVL